MLRVRTPVEILAAARATATVHGHLGSLRTLRRLPVPRTRPDLRWLLLPALGVVFDPDTYEELMAEEVPAYPRLQREVAAATRGVSAKRILDLGAGTGVTALGVLAEHPGAKIVGVDVSATMLTRARSVLPRNAHLHVARLEDALPEGPFDLVISALAVHHLDGPGKADLFRRVAAILEPSGRLVLGDVIVPEDPADVVTPIDDDYDRPSSVADHLVWLDAAGFDTRLTWTERDLAVFAADLRH